MLVQFWLIYETLFCNAKKLGGLIELGPLTSKKEVILPRETIWVISLLPPVAISKEDNYVFGKSVLLFLPLKPNCISFNCIIKGR